MQKYSYDKYTVVVTATEAYILRYIKGKSKRMGPGLNRDGYERAKVNGKTKFIHSIIAEVTIGSIPEGCVVNHKDGNKRNNHPSNLEYITPIANIKHAVKLGIHASCDPVRNGNYRHGKCVAGFDRKACYQEKYLENRETILAQQKEKRRKAKNDSQTR